MLGLLAFWAMSIPTSLVMQYGALYKMTGLAANNGYLINKDHNNDNMYSDLIRVIIENTPEFDLYTVFPLLNLITSLNFSYLIAKNQYAIWYFFIKNRQVF